mgnify:CR=1 FL=1
MNENMMPTPDQLREQQKQQQVAELGSLLHDEWRAPRKQEDGTFEPRMKKTKDQDWIDKHGTEDIDIANSSYNELPEDWKGENKISAEVAMDQIYEAISQQKELDVSFIEDASSVIHDKWLERNKDWAPAEQNKPYGELSEEEKDKDRAIIKKAIEVYNGAK